MESLSNEMCLSENVVTVMKNVTNFYWQKRFENPWLISRDTCHLNTLSKEKRKEYIIVCISQKSNKSIDKNCKSQNMAMHDLHGHHEDGLSVAKRVLSEKTEKFKEKCVLRWAGHQSWVYPAPSQSAGTHSSSITGKIIFRSPDI